MLDALSDGLRVAIDEAEVRVRAFQRGASPKGSGPDVVRAMSTELFLDFLGIRMDSSKAAGMEFTINLVTPDNGEQYVIELSNATLTNIEGYQASDPDLTITINRKDLEQTLMGAKTMAAQIADGTAKTEGDATILEKLASTFIDFEIGFEIMPGTAGPPTDDDDTNPYEVQEVNVHGE